MATTSLVATLQAIRTRLLAFNGGQLGTALGADDEATGAGADGRLYLDQAPDNAAYPYGILHVLDWREQGDDGGYARRLQLEIQLVDRPRVKAAAVKAMGDTVERAMRAWADVSAGPIVAQRGLTRATVLYEEPADREVVMERLVVPFYVHPQYHTQDSA